MSTLVKGSRVTASIIEQVAQNMRQADIDELWASQNLKPMEGLKNSVLLSTVSEAIFFNDDLIGIWGLVAENRLYPSGVPWFIGTDEIEKYPKTFLKTSRYILNVMENSCPKLANYVYAESETSIRYLKKLGFAFHDQPVPVGASGELFYKFEKGAESCAIQSRLQ